MKKILIFGSTGMLGSMVTNYFLNRKFIVGCTYRSEALSFIVKEKIENEYFFDANDDNYENKIKEILDDFHPNYIINCIGLIKMYCNSNDSKSILNAINVNSIFPHKLSFIAKQISAKIKILQIATDCVYDGVTGFYTEDSLHNAEDIYGKTKSMGEVFAKNVLNIRCSIIGPELKSRTSLLEWVISNYKKDVVNGYLHHIWNGVTTLQFAKYCYYIIKEEKYEDIRSLGNVIHYVINNTVTKYDLVKYIKEVYNLNFQIKAVVEPNPRINRALFSKKLFYDLSDMKFAIIKLKEYTDECDWYK